MASEAIKALRPILPFTADAIEADLVGPGKPIPSWAPPANQAEQDAQYAPLVIGQLKAIAHPFYQHLHAAAPAWLENERITNGTNSSGSIFPWTADPADDNNRGIAVIGQLKAVFSLRFELDPDSNGYPELWVQAGIDPQADADGDGLTNHEEYLLGTNPWLMDSDGDGIPDMEDPDPLDPQILVIAASSSRVLTPLR